jgi:hypothetical protein
MTWSNELQMEAERRLAGFSSEFHAALEAWQQSIQSSVTDTSLSTKVVQLETAMKDVLRRWRLFLQGLREKSETAVHNQGIMDVLQNLVAQVSEEKQTLEKLRSEAGTRADQADSLNPKVRPSPYTNILGLQRTFRDSTRFAILITSIVFAVLAIAVLGFLVYRIYVTGQVVLPGFSTSVTSLRGGGKK